MPKPQTAPDVIDQIKAASFSESHESLSERLGLSVSTVRKYRRELRRDRQDAARSVIAEHVERNIPDALQDLTDLRLKARDTYEGTGDSKDGQLWLAAIKTTLEHVRPDDAALDATIENELAGLAERRQGTAPSACAGGERTAPAFN